MEGADSFRVSVEGGAFAGSVVSVFVGPSGVAGFVVVVIVDDGFVVSTDSAEFRVGGHRTEQHQENHRLNRECGFHFIFPLSLKMVHYDITIEHAQESVN